MARRLAGQLFLMRMFGEAAGPELTAGQMDRSARVDLAEPTDVVRTDIPREIEVSQDKGTSGPSRQRPKRLGDGADLAAASAAV
jgi:hypothetical protein